MANIKDIAASAGVSIGTVSNYLNGTHKVREDTAQRIQTAIELLNYRVNYNARSLKCNENKEICVVIPNLRDPYFTMILAGIENELSQAEYYLNVAISNDIPEQEISVLNTFLKKNIIGLIIISCQPDNAEYFQNNFHNNNTATVFIDRKINNLDANFLSFDYYDTIHHLLSQLYSTGHRDISLVVGNKNFHSEIECIRAYNDFCDASGIADDQRIIRYTNSSKEDAFRTGINLLSEQKLSVIITSSQSILMGIEKAVALKGLKAGEDIVVISLGQEEWGGYKAQNGIINTMRPAYWVGKKSAQLLAQNLATPILFEKKQLKLNDKIIGEVLFEPESRRSKNRGKAGKSLNILLWESSNAEAIKKIIFTYTEKYGVDTHIDTMPQEDILDTILKNKKYDVVMYDLPWLELLVKDEVLLDVSSYVESEHFNKNAFLFDLLDTVGRYDNKYYGLPVLYSPQLLLYRKDFFQDASLRSSFYNKYHVHLAPPKTWSEFNAICEFFTESVNPDSPVPYGTSVAGASMERLVPEFMSRLWAYNGELFDENNNILVKSSSFKKALNSIRETFKYATPESVNNSYTQAAQEFYKGNAAMLVCYAVHISDVNNYLKSEIVGKIGYSEIPGKSSVLGAWGFGITTQCQNASTAFDFMAWACGPSLNNYFTILNGQSAIQSVYEHDELINLYPWLSLMLKAYPDCRVRESKRINGEKIIPVTSIEKILYKHIYNMLETDCDAQSVQERIFEDMTLLLTV